MQTEETLPNQFYEATVNLIPKLLKKTKDTRYLDDPTQDDIWETYPRLSGAMRTFPAPLLTD